MQSFEQNKSTDKHSSHESQDRKKPRPSLFPIRNSAKRKSSFNQAHNIFDPHCYNTAQTNASHNLNYSDRVDHKDNKSDTSFQYKTPSIQSDYESPKSARSTPKQFVFDTPFVPFVHQSLTKVVWESEEVIPEERDDIERKQSQTQNIKFMQIPQQDENQKQEKNYTENQLQQGRETFQNEPKIYQQTTFQIKQQNECQNISPVFQSCNALSLTVESKQKDKIEKYSQNLFQLKVQNGLEQADRTIEQKTQQNQNIQLVSDIQHCAFVSKAPVYYEQEQQTISRKMGLSLPQYLQIQMDKEKQGKKFCFSYIDSISIRPILKVSKGKQTFPKILNVCRAQNISIGDKQGVQQECQIDNIKFQISNSFYDQIKSIKKKDCGFQLQYRDRLEHIKKNVQQRIGYQKVYNNTDQQTVIQLSQVGQQTERPYKRSLRINQQMNISISNNFPYFDEKINRLQYFIKDLYDSKEAELKNVKNRRSVDKQTNTDILQPPVPSSHKKSNNSAIKSFRNFACQYDQKDTGLRPSLKRVSIADTKVVYEIEQSNSTETFTQKQQKKGGKGKSKRSSQNVKVKIQPNGPDQQQQTAYNEVEVEVEKKRSKRKNSKTPSKKKPKN